MPIRIDDVKRQRKEKDRQFEPAVERAQGVLLGLDSADSAEVRNRPGFVWYRRPGSTSSAAQALNRKLLPVPGLPVILQRVPPTGSWEVVDVDTNTLSQLDDYQGAYLDRHAREHEPGGNDPLYVYLRMITPLRTTPGTGVAVSVAPLVYDNAGVLTTFGGNNGLSLSSNVPGSGLARYVLVYLDPTTNTLTTANGDTAPNGGAVALSFPAVPAGAVPSAYVRLEYGQTTITESNIVDARLLLNGMTTAGGYLKATGETTGATLQSQQFDLGVNIADNNGVGFYSTTPAIKAYLYQNEADDRFYISAETPVQFDMYQDDVIQVTDSSTATVLEFDPATGVLSTDGLDSVAGSGIAVADDLLLASGSDVYPDGSANGLNARFERLFGDDVPVSANSWTNNPFYVAIGNNQIGFETNTTASSDSWTTSGNFSKSNTGTVYFYANAHYLRIDSLAAGPAQLIWTDASAITQAEIHGQFSVRRGTIYGGEIRLWGVQSPGASDKYWAIRFIQDVTTYPGYPWRVKLFKGTGITYSTTDGTEVGQAPHDILRPIAIIARVTGAGVMRAHIGAYHSQYLVGEVYPDEVLSATDATYPTSFKTMCIHIPGTFQRSAIDSIKVS